MSGNEDPEIPRALREAVDAARRLLYRYEAITPTQAYHAVRFLLVDTDVDVSPEELLDPREEPPEPPRPR